MNDIQRKIVKKWIIGISIGIASVLVLAIIISFVFLNSIVKKGVETVGPKITKTPITMEGADLSPFSGSGKISGLAVGNPEGFHTPTAIKMGSVKLAVQPTSLLSDVIKVDEVNIQGPEITCELGLHGSNLGKLLDNVKSFGKSTNAPAAEEKAEIKKEKSTESKPGKNIYIKQVTVENGKINVSITALGGKVIPMPLPPIHIKEIGTPERGITPAEAVEKILEAIVTSAVEVAQSAAVNVGDATKEGATKAASAITGLFKKSSSTNTATNSTKH